MAPEDPAPPSFAPGDGATEGRPISGRRRAAGGTLAVIGYLLSPLSWWNDAFINFPIAYGAANLAALVSKSWFEPALYAAYWLTNLVGFVLMHAGVAMGVSKPKPITWKLLGWQFLVTLAYTLLVVALVRRGLISPLVK